jgi:hypothetical protein
MTPADLAHSPIWVAWRAERRNGKPTKVPYAPRTGQRATADDPATWARRARTRIHTRCCTRRGPSSGPRGLTHE